MGVIESVPSRRSLAFVPRFSRLIEASRAKSKPFDPTLGEKMLKRQAFDDFSTEHNVFMNSRPNDRRAIGADGGFSG